MPTTFLYLLKKKLAKSDLSSSLWLDFTIQNGVYVDTLVNKGHEKVVFSTFKLR